MKAKAQKGNIWVFTDTAHNKALSLNLPDANQRQDGMSAYLGHELLDEYAPRLWLEKGYIKEQLRSEAK